MSLLRPALLAFILVVAAVARLSGASSVLSAGELVPADDDSTYHLGRMTRGAASLPLPAFDPSMNWPHGALVPWADGFDLLGAAVMRAAGGPAALDRAGIAVALLPVALGLLVVWATWSLAARLVPAHATGAAAAAALLVAVLPQAVAASRFARLDHHVLESLSLLLLAAWGMSPWWRDGEPGRSRGDLLRDELAAAGAATLAVAGFAGGTLYVAMAVAVRIAAVVTTPPLRLLGSGSAGLALGAALTAFLTWPGIAARGFALSFDGPSLLQPLLLLTAAAGTALAAGVARGTGGVARRLSLVALSVLALAAAALAVPAIRGPIRDGFVRFLLRRDPWLAGIQEFQPLFDGSPPVPQLTYYFGSVGVLAPLLAAAGIAFAARSRRSTAAAFAWFLLCAAALTLLQVRFGRVLAPLLAVAAGLAIAWLASALARRLPGPAPTATVLAVLVAAGLVGADERLRGAFRVGASPISPAAEAALDLRAAPLDPSLPGVHSAWDLGHGLSILGCRPVLTNGFGSFLDHDAFAEAEGALGLTAGAYEAFLDRRKVGIVVAGPATFRVRPPGGRDWYEAGERGAVLDVASLRALPLSPLLIAGSALPAADVRHLEHLMVRFASTKVVGGLSFDLPLLWSYERVPGARLRGRTAPAVRVVASIPLRERGRPHAWKAFADADARGRWEMILPVPSALVTPTVTTGPRFELRAGAGPAVVISVPEAAVRGGSTIHVTTPIPFVAPRE